MGKLRSFQIQLDNAGGIFWAGQTVSGRAIVDLEAEMKMRGIIIFLSFSKSFTRIGESPLSAIVLIIKRLSREFIVPKLP
jgi:hypothetical protein